MDYYKMDCYLVCENCGKEDEHASHGWALDGGTAVCPDCVKPMFNEYANANYGIQDLVDEAIDWIAVKDLFDACESMMEVRRMILELDWTIKTQSAEYMLRRQMRMKRDKRRNV